MSEYRKPLEVPPKSQSLSNTRRTIQQVVPSAPKKTLFEIEVDEKPRGAETGLVSLVGAGPGDPELLTIKALRVLQSADIILFDDLVADEILELARTEAKRLLVGKRGGRISCKQDDINKLMIKLALQGKHVVRLKSGDPLIFGRAGEEITELERHGIEVRIVPGITAALGAASQMGVSLTHRDRAQSVRFLTAHSKKGGLPEDVDWSSVADPDCTLMIYMGGRTAPALAKRLIKEGLSPQSPVVILTSVSRMDERRHYCRLVDLNQKTGLGVDSPVIIGVGRVFENLVANRREAPIETQMTA